MVFRLLSERTHCECAQKGGNFAEFSILGLQLGRKFVSLHERRVFELYLPFCPFLPILARIDDWISINFLVFSQKIRHVFNSYQLLQILQEHGVVNIPIIVLLGQLFVLFRSPQFFLGSLVNQSSDFVISRQYSKLKSGQSVGSHEFAVSSMLQQITHNSDVVSLYRCHKRSLSVFSGMVNYCSALLDKKGGGLEVSVVGSSEERRHFCLFSQLVVQKIWPFVQKLLYVVMFLPVDVVQQVFAV